MRVPLLSIFLFNVILSSAQMTVSGKVSPNDTLVFNVPFSSRLYERFSYVTVSDKNGNFSIVLPVNKPQTIFLKQQNTRFHLYAEPDQNLYMEKTDSIRFYGGLGRENEFRRKIGLTGFRLGEENWNDTLSHPNHILDVLKINQERALSSLQSSHLSKDFVSMTQADIRYFPVSKMWNLIWANMENNKSKYPLDEWKTALVHYFSDIEMSDSTAVNSYHYQVMVANYLFYLNQQMKDPENARVLVEKIFGKAIEELDKDTIGERYWEYCALNYGFKGISLEYVLASFIIDGIAYGNLDYLNEAYNDFCHRFPDSRYMVHVKQIIQPYLESRQTDENSDIRFITEQPQDLDALINRFKGKVLYIDLWGTWCGPCRREFAFNKALKEKFASEEVEFVYIAVEFARNPTKKWQEMVKFYDISGYHFLADQALEADLRKRYDRDGTISFPSYILVGKSGNIITLHARRPSDKEELYQQIRKLL